MVKHWLMVSLVLIHTVSFAGAKQESSRNTDRIILTDTTEHAVDNWFNLDPSEDHVLGISTEKAYQTFLKGKKSKTVVVAIIDSGIDINHEDLEGKIWENTDEIEGNGIDDDKNGYVDDVHGWNFIGGKDGENVVHDSNELTRLYASLKNKYEGKDPASLSKEEKKEYEQYLEVKEKYESKVNELQEQYTGFASFRTVFDRSNKLMEAYFGVEDVPYDSVEHLDSPDMRVMQAGRIVLYAYENGLDKEKFEEGEEYFSNSLEYGYNPDYNPRTIVGDNYNDVTEKIYGNNDVIGPYSRHGTHVAGIVAADRYNGVGMKGVAENVKIMVIRAVPDGDERDKDVANAIYYAVDNGAQIINMSFGKSYSPDKEVVDNAVKYAESKGVLLVHAAGNDGENTDKAANFPNREYTGNKKQASNWLEVGASSWKKDSEMVAEFSNYGKKSVDVFAPGTEIYSTTPNQTYESLDGTSMAAPVVTGVAALLMSYYPNLSAQQIKDVILTSSVKFNKLKVNRPGSVDTTKFSDLSSTGGVVNAYEAVKQADALSNKIEKR